MAGKSSYTQDIGELICHSLREGESLLSISKRLGIKRTTIIDWTTMFPAFGDNYARAREDGDDVEFERLTELASEEPPRVKGFVDSGWVAWKRNQIDLAKWMLARKRPKKYGDRTAIEHSGEVNVTLAERIAQARKRVE